MHRGAFLLPPTSGLFGRPSNRDSHWLYRSDLVSDPAIDKAVIKFDDPSEPDKKKAKLLELRIGGAAGAQTVFPPSVHPSGEAIAWSNGKDPDPPTIPGHELLAKSRRLAAAALLGRHWPRQTGMHNAAILIGGLLRRTGWTIADITLFIEAVARAGGDVSDIKDRIRTARDAAEAFDAGKKTQGLPTLEKTFGKDVADALADWLGLRRGAASQPTAAAGPKPVIRLGPNLAAVAAETERAIFAAGLPIFARDTLLVRPVDHDAQGRENTGRQVRRDPGALSALHHGRCRRFRAIRQPDEKLHCRQAAQPKSPKSILTRSDHWPFKPAHGILMCQSMRPDGSLILAPGYDAATGLFLIGLPAMPAISGSADQGRRGCSSAHIEGRGARVSAGRAAGPGGRACRR